jgi:hypothetical protein
MAPKLAHINFYDKYIPALQLQLVLKSSSANYLIYIEECRLLGCGTM